ncbi:MAG TPA: zinc ribbon domain-containing protein [Rhodanobacteraceae bacterium]|jgi:putative FmdB family regulatory protein|nr:zinc ribbon domain-containing protein [Rhodanobacteraceae bacterium]
MPIYVFRCEACGHKFDRLQKLSAPDPDVCPHCGKHATVRRQVTAPAFRLAGSGWYETDFKSDREKKHNLADNGAPKAETTPGKSGEAGKHDAAAKPPASEKSAPAADD